MKLYSRSIWQRSSAILMLVAMLSVQGIAQMAAKTATVTKPASLSKVERELTRNISLDSIKAYTNALASDEMEGRGTMQPGGDKAANWIADKFKDLGLKPLGDNGTYLQLINFKQTEMAPETTFQVGDEKFKLGKEYGFTPLPFKKSDKNITADMVFVGYGTQAFNTGASADALGNIRGKVVVYINGPPANFDKERWDKMNGQSLIFQSLAVGGAKALVVLGNGRKDDQIDTYVDYFGRRQISLADEKPAYAPIPIPPMIMITRATAEKLFSKSGAEFKDLMVQAEAKDFKPINLNQQATIVEKYKTSTGTSSNVAGYIEGSDPKLKAEAVLFSAHYDAYGIENGQIFNGAADNALGTSEMIAVAEAYSKMKPKPKRSMIFLAVTGEEYGLYGSKYWADNPTWELSKIAGNLNLDGIGTEVYGPVKNMVGFGAEHSTLGAMLEDVAKSYGIKLMPDPQPEEKVFTRSDHYSFVKKGIPALMLMGAPEGTKEEIVAKIKAWEKVNYHQPTDDVMDNWHWEGAKTVADMMGILGLRISNQEKAPTWLSTSEYSKIDRNPATEPNDKN
ncbi:MAG: M28 family peptidase [Pyrinomonadaceae bacterium]|nr:M28 family peptidase [Pyrinomonadaceae bacterium]